MYIHMYIHAYIRTYICTYVHMQVSLFFDIFMCLTKDMSASDFEAGRYARIPSKSSQYETLLAKFRASLWIQLVERNKVKLKASEWRKSNVCSVCCCMLYDP